MKLYFRCKTNHDYTEINCAVFAKGDRIYRITFWDSAMYTDPDSPDECEIEWDGLYDTDESDMTPLPTGFFNDAKFVKLEINDDAPADYMITVEEWDYTETDWD